MNNRTISFLFVFLLMQGVVLSQSLDLRFSKVFYSPSSGMHILASAEAGQDSLLMISIPGYYGYYGNTGSVHMMDATGVMHWSKSLVGEGSSVMPVDIVRTSDGDFLICAAETSTEPSEVSVLLIKLNAAGDLLWVKKFEHETDVFPSGIALTGGGDILVTGRSLLSDFPNESKLLLLRFTTDGALLWAKTYETAALRDEGLAVAELANGQLMVGGITKGSSPYSVELSLTQTDAAGNVLWAKQKITPGSYSNSHVNDLIAGPTGFYLSGNSIDAQGYVMSFNTDGEINWSKSMGMSYDWYESVYRGRINTIVGGDLLLSTGSLMGDGMVCQLTTEGNPVWSQYVFMQAMVASPLSDGGYLLLGNGPIYGVKDVYEPQTGVIRTNALGEGLACTGEGDMNSADYVPVFENLTYTVMDVGSAGDYSLQWEDFPLSSDGGCVAFYGAVEQTPDAVNALKAYPNPGNGPFRLQLADMQPDSLVRLTVYNSKGQFIYSREGNWNQLQMIDMRLSAGIYLINLQTTNNIFTTRLIVK